MDKLLNPARNKGESFEKYVVRRAGVNALIEQRLKVGRDFYTHPHPVEVEKGKWVQPPREPYVKEKKDE